MPLPLNNIATANTYTPACTAGVFPDGRTSVSLGVFNAAVYFRVTTRRGGVPQASQAEVFLQPGQGSLDAGVDWPDGEYVYQVEYRSAVAGVPAQIRCN